MNSLRSIILTLLLSVGSPVLASITLSESIQTFHVALDLGTPLERVLRDELGDHYSDARVVLTGAIASTPGDVADIIRIAIDEGVLADDIAAQCETMLNQRQLIELIRVSLGERIDPAPVIRRCFIYVPNSEVSDLLALAINNSTPGQIERVLEAAFQALSTEVADPFALVKEGVLRSNAFTVEGIEYAEEVDDLVTEIRLQDVLEVVVAEEGNNIDEIAEVDTPPPEAGGGDEGGGTDGGGTDGGEPPMSDS